MKKVLIVLVPCVLMLAGCNDSHYSDSSSSYSNSHYSDARVESQQSYPSRETESFNTSARGGSISNSPNWGGFPVNSTAVCKTG